MDVASASVIDALFKLSRTFLQHGHAQVLFTLRLCAAQDGLALALLRGKVTHRQDLDLTLLLLRHQALHPC